jgi:hypothetical protein
MTTFEILLIWTLLGVYGVGIEHGASTCGEQPKRAHQTGGSGIAIRLVLYGPFGWLLLGLIYILPRFVDSRVRT